MGSWHVIVHIYILIELDLTYSPYSHTCMDTMKQLTAMYHTNRKSNHHLPIAHMTRLLFMVHILCRNKEYKYNHPFLDARKPTYEFYRQITIYYTVITDLRLLNQ